MTAARRPQAVLFDLDGTLADTAADLARALNSVLRDEGRPQLPFARIRPTVSLGGLAMLRMAFPGDEGDALADRYRRFLDYYAAAVAEQTALFPGMAQVLDAVEAAGLRWGIVTNKITRLTEPILDALGLRLRCACTVCGDTIAHAKPHPAPLLHACNVLNIAPQGAVYIGDAQRDVDAGKQAGMATIIARYGYIEDGATVESWGADHLIDRPEDLIRLLDL